MRHLNDQCNFGCPVEAAIEVVGGKWKGVILFHLSSETIRFNQLQKLMPSITQRMLTKQLRELERDTIVKRRVYPVVPPKVEYNLTEFGQTLIPILKELEIWGNKYLERLSEIRENKTGDTHPTNQSPEQISDNSGIK